MVDRRTVRRYVKAGRDARLARNGGGEHLSELLVGVVCERVRPHRRAGQGQTWRVANDYLLKKWVVEEELTVVKGR